MSKLLQVIGTGKPSVYHAAVVLFLEFFAFGLLAIPMLDVSCVTIVVLCKSLQLLLKCLSVLITFKFIKNISKSWYAMFISRKFVEKLQMMNLV